VSFFLTLAVFTFPKTALAEKILAKGDDWQVYTDGRVGGFFSWVYGQGFPQNTVVQNPSDPNAPGISIFPLGGGWKAGIEQPAAVNGQQDQGTINSMRIRSGFIGNQLGLGVRGQATPSTTVTGYIQIWAWIESSMRKKGFINTADVRQGYAKVEGPWGSVLAGRTRTLFSRGATDINTLYAHRWGLGFTGGGQIDDNGPTQGMIGFGVMGSGFSSAIIYATPVLLGFQLSVGAFDPVQSQGAGNYSRTKYVRPEAELTFERKFGNTGKVVLFVNGEYQKVYKDSYCAPDLNPIEGLRIPCEQAAEGVGYGGRFELGPFHLGVAGHYGKGLGFNYALEVSDAASDQSGVFRMTDGYYVQTQVVLRKFDLFAGWGIVRAFRTFGDTYFDTANPPTQFQSVISYQMGINGGVVYNLTPQIHIDLDYFRAKAVWSGANLPNIQTPGERQALNVLNTGMTFNW
jgi:predicted porin